MKKAIYKFYFDCGRQGSLEGVFISTQEKVDALIGCGDEVYFGEVLGKHSEVYGPVEVGDITLMSDNKETVNTVETYRLTSGYDPFEYCFMHSNDTVEDVINEMIKP